jgi:alpha-L-fucosidase
MARKTPKTRWGHRVLPTLPTFLLKEPTVNRFFKSLLAVLLLGALLCGNRPSIAEETPEKETPAQRDARMKWWREARFGMFIHWGVYSVPAGTHNDKKIDGIGEWIMFHGKIPTADYQKYAKDFNPVKYDAEAWVKLAKEAGMKYMVITAKHHDGFAMYDSKVSDWNIVKATPFGRDPLKELAAACKKYDMKLGFYYSQAQDWNNRGAAAGPKWDKAQEGSMDEYIDKIAVPQVKEILSNYGPISVLWWDTPCDMNKERAAKLLPPLKLQPGIIWNNRLGGGFEGDSETPEQEIPATGFPGGRDWETCMTMNDTWGFKSYDNNWKSTETLIRNLVDIASKGGNYLLNVGPTSEGLIPEPSVERLKEVGKWMTVNEEAIYGTSASPFKKLEWGRCTKKVHEGGTTLYLHVFDWPKDGKLNVPGLKSEVQKAFLLVDGGIMAVTEHGPLHIKEYKKLNFETNDQGLVIELPQNPPDKICSIIIVQTTGDLRIEAVLPTQDADGKITLSAADAICHGEGIKTEERDGKTNLGYWTNAGDWAEWDFKITKPGKFTVTAEIAGPDESNLQVNVGSKTSDANSVSAASALLSTTVSKTGDYAKFETVKLGEIEIPAGKADLTVKPVSEGWHAINLRSVTLTPAK